MGDERREDRWGKREIEIRKVTLRNLQGLEKHVFSPEEGLAVEMDVVSSTAIKDFVFGMGVYDSSGVSCYGTNTNIEEFQPLVIHGEGKVVCRIEKLNLINGTYYLDVAVHKIDGYPYDYHRNLYSFLVSSTHKDVGIARLPHAWSFSPVIKIKK
jgi:ABC-2 type transport system ATP-binding protein/lipopolysaccharide transport system ATP-binding protein